jgi:hypothetical protein
MVDITGGIAYPARPVPSRRRAVSLIAGAVMFGIAASLPWPDPREDDEKRREVPEDREFPHKREEPPPVVPTGGARRR